jgi:hypothetical protein
MPRPRTIQDHKAHMREYMRAYRAAHPKPKKRRELDRSKPKGENVKLDRPGYQRQYMRWVRAGKPQ